LCSACSFFNAARAMHDLRQLIEMPSYRAQVTYLPREVLEDDLELPSMPPLLGVNAPPPPLHRTPSRDGLHRAPGALGPGPPPPAQSGRAISLPALHLRGYVVTRIGREHQRRGQACEDVADWRAPLVENSAAANAFAWPPGPMSQSASLAIAAANMSCPVQQSSTRSSSSANIFAVEPWTAGYCTAAAAVTAAGCCRLGSHWQTQASGT